MGRCGEPFETQIHWFADLLNYNNDGNSYNNNKNNNYNNNTETTKTIIKKNILYIKRNTKRKVPNQHEVIESIQKYSLLNNFNFFIHDDNKLPSLKQQAELFQKMDIIVAPHGAGSLFMLFTTPFKSCFIEFVPVSNVCQTCYPRLAYYRKINYISYLVQNDFKININDVLNGLKKCNEAIIDF
jgi:capsular polysaccharide biosynthesis protein